MINHRSCQINLSATVYVGARLVYATLKAHVPSKQRARRDARKQYSHARTELMEARILTSLREL